MCCPLQTITTWWSSPRRWSRPGPGSPTCPASGSSAAGAPTWTTCRWWGGWGTWRWSLSGLMIQDTDSRIIFFSLNGIETLSDFQSCHNLQELFLRGNQICSLREILWLKDLCHLKNLWLAENPCADGSERWAVCRGGGDVTAVLQVQADCHTQPPPAGEAWQYRHQLPRESNGVEISTRNVIINLTGRGSALWRGHRDGEQRLLLRG